MEALFATLLSVREKLKCFPKRTNFASLQDDVRAEKMNEILILFNRSWQVEK